VDLVVERALKATMTENKSKFTDVLEINTCNEDIIDSATTAVTVQSTKSRRVESKTKRRTSRTASREKGLNLSLETRAITSTTSGNEKRTASSKFSLSKAESPVSAMSGKAFFHIPKEAPSSRRNKETNSISQRVTSPTRTGDSPHQPRSSVAHTRSFVQSEFNHIKGSVKFSKSPKGNEVFEESPGPGAYESGRYSQRQSPRVVIGKSAKVCWFDVVARNDSPGPASLYPSHHFSSKGKNQ